MIHKKKKKNLSHNQYGSYYLPFAIVNHCGVPTPTLYLWKVRQPTSTGDGVQLWRWWVDEANNTAIKIIRHKIFGVEIGEAFFEKSLKSSRQHLISSTNTANAPLFTRVVPSWISLSF